MTHAQTTFGQTRPSGEHREEARGIVGGHIGRVSTMHDIGDAFGSGVAVELFFHQKFLPYLGVNFNLGNFYLGASKRDDLTQDRFGDVIARMNIYHLTAGPITKVGILERSSLYFMGGLGVYGVSLSFDDRALLGTSAQNHFGINFGSGYLYAISEKWRLDANFTGHVFWTGKTDDDLVYYYSEGKSNPFFYQVSVGIAVSFN